MTFTLSCFKVGVMKNKIELRPIVVSKAIHKRVRYLAFQRHVSMKTIMEEALCAHYHWQLEEEEETNNGNAASPSQRPSP